MTKGVLQTPVRPPGRSLLGLLDGVEDRTETELPDDEWRRKLEQRIGELERARSAAISPRALPPADPEEETIRDRLLRIAD